MMKVIFLKDVKGAGRRDEMKEVSDGYAMNALIPAGHAVQATPTAIAAWEKRKSVEIAAHAQSEKASTLAAKHLDGKSIVITTNANEQGHLYKQLSLDVIAECIRNEYGVSISPDSIHLEEGQVKTLGEHSAVVRLGTHKVRLIVSVRRSE